jgi:excisionase family DNA binding protein
VSTIDSYSWEVTVISFRDVHGIADELGVDVQTVRRWIHSGKLKAFKPGKEYRVREADLEEFLTAREVRPKVPRRSPSEPSFNDMLEEERRYYGSHVWQRINLLDAAAEQWQQFLDKGLYDFEKLDLELLKAVERVYLEIVLNHGREAAAIKRASTDEQRARLEQAEQRLIDTNLEFWAHVEKELERRKVTDLGPFRAWREESEQVSRSSRTA